jgi:hypothetical protein
MYTAIQRTLGLLLLTGTVSAGHMPSLLRVAVPASLPPWSPSRPSYILTSSSSSSSRYQLADWRLRPLPADMAHYARCDTRFLLHAADALRRELVAAGSRIAPGREVDVPPSTGAGQV